MRKIYTFLLLSFFFFPVHAEEQKNEDACIGSKVGAATGATAGATTGLVVGGVAGATVAGGVGFLCATSLAAGPFTFGTTFAIAAFTCGSWLITATAIGAGTGTIVGGVAGAVGGKELGELVDPDCKK